MDINIVLPYDESGKYYKKWAYEENSIDFALHRDKAIRCTASFGCEEMVTYLAKIGHNVTVDSARKTCFNIMIECEDSESEEFDIIVDGDDIILHGCGRAGVLYSVYELLEAQGVRWYAPNNEYVPMGGDLVLPEARHYKYALPRSRGFCFEDLQNESESFILWMARNRFCFHAMHIHCKNLQQKLCMEFETGGHIFTDLMNPLNIEDDGRYYIDAHRDWYGKRDEEITAKNAMRVQFCVTNEELLERMADVVIEKLKTDWADMDSISLDGFDTWGHSCNCDNCKKLGNGSDRTMYFISHIRGRINSALESGELKKNVKIIFCIYDGTDTMLPPENAVPHNLIEAGDAGTYSPILRCYSHYIDESCSRNSRYEECLQGWLATGLNISVDEYYNVSKIEDLPFVCTDKILHDIRHYIKSGISKFMYMHVFVKEWGVRALNHYIMANVCRNPDFDDKGYIKKYFEDMYGNYAADARAAYEKVELATEYIQSWRAWNKGSVITSLILWDGKRPQQQLECDDHLYGRVADEGYKSSALINEALDTMRDIRKKALANLQYSDFPAPGLVVNPIEQAKGKAVSSLVNKLNEDIRGLKYGHDVYMMMTLMADYYNALYMGDDAKSEDLYQKIYALGADMSEYTYSVVFDSYKPDFELRDALLRSQLNELYYRIIAMHK